MARYRACVVLAAAIGCTPNTAPEPDASKQDAAKVEGLAKHERPAQGEAPVGDPEPKKGEAPVDVEAPKPTAHAESEAHTPEPDGDEAPEVQKAEPNDGATIVPASEVPVSKVQVEPAVVTWRTVTTVDAPVAFEPISRGVLGRDSSTHKFYDVDENGAFVQRDIEAPDGPILGTWPKNAWYVEIREKEITGDRSGEVERTLRLMRLRGKKRWVPQRFDGEQRFEDQGERFIASAKSGLLVVEWGGEDITRITDNAVPDPELGVTKNGPLVGVFETRKGTLYSARVSGDRVYVQRNCSEDEYMCVTINAAPLPEDTMWKFRGAVARAKYSVSAIAEHGNQETPHLLHYGGGEWKLEKLETAPEVLLPGKGGGMWMVIDGALRHRDGAGVWREIALPEGANTITAAMRGDFGELWVSAIDGGKTTIYATAGTYTSLEQSAESGI